ncbi:MAG: RHS repeat-associated core domain-containing protein, partial [Blastocatellia bacterium]
RVTKIVGVAWTHYIWQGSQVIGEHDATTVYTTNPTYQVNSARVDYIYAGSRMISSRDRSSSGAPWATKYYLSDRLSTRLVLSPTGTVLGRQAHLPFGEDFAASGTQEKHHFTSYERDGESGLDYAVNRGYSAAVGRFLSADPYRPSGYLVDPQSWNRYSYARNNATNRVDPLGLDDDDPIVLRGWAYYDREWSYDQKYGNSVNGSRGDDIEIEQPADPNIGGGKGVIKSYRREFVCGKKAANVLKEIEKDFSKFANTAQTFGLGNLITAIVTFGSAPVSTAGIIPITQTTLFPAIIVPGQVNITPPPIIIETSVTVYNVLPNSFSFVTNEGHPLYPGQITFGAEDKGDGQIIFSINVNAQLNGVINETLFGLGGNELEDRIWNNLIDNVEKFCSQ